MCPYGKRPTRKTLEKEPLSLIEYLNKLFTKQKLPSAFGVKRGKILLNKIYKNMDVEVSNTQIGEGNQGSVCYAKISSKIVCVKLLFSAAEPGFFQEIWKLIVDFSCTHFPHQNVVNYMGFYTGEDGKIGLVMEKLECSLEDVIDANAGTDFEKMGLALDIASGLQFLHHNGIIHCDLRADNILLDENGRAKVADFGYSYNKFFRIRLQEDIMDLGIAPPEDEEALAYYKNRDVYAFGMVLFQLFTGKEFVNTGDLESQLRNTKFPVYKETDIVIELVRKCLGEAANRPNFDLIVSELLKIRDEPHMELAKDTSVILDSGRNPAHYYCLFGKQDLLKKIPTDELKLRDNYGFLPIHYAAACGYTDIVYEIWKRYPECIHNSDNIRNSPPLILAVQRIKYDTANVLLKCGADPNCSAETINLTPLHCAATGGLNMIILLLGNGANPTTQTEIMSQLPSSIRDAFIEQHGSDDTSPMALAKEKLDNLSKEESALIMQHFCRFAATNFGLRQNLSQLTSVARLTEMGFSLEESREALRMCNGDVEWAATLLAEKRVNK